MGAACQGDGEDAVDMEADTVERSVPPQAHPPHGVHSYTDSRGIAINIMIIIDLSHIWRTSNFVG